MTITIYLEIYLFVTDNYKNDKDIVKVGNILLYDCDGKQQYTIYLGETPEHGKGHTKLYRGAEYIIDFCLK